MQKIIYLLTCIISIQILNAQDTISFKDEFNDNRHGWDLGVRGGNNVNIKDGKFIYESTSNNAQWALLNFFFDPKKEFIFECSARHLSGIDNKGFGLVLGADNGDNYQVFNISKNGYYIIYEYRKNNYQLIKDWTANSTISASGVNTLKIKKAGSYLFYYINGEQVFQTEYTPLVGKYFGFYHGDKMKVEYDNLIMRQDLPTKIKLVKDLQTGLVRESLGSNVNSAYEDKMPVISPDGKTLYIDREDDPQNTGEKKQDDIWISQMMPNGKWNLVKKAPYPLNNSGPNFVISVTPDNNMLLLGNTYKEDGSPLGGGFSISHKTGSGWSTPTKVNVKNYTNKHEYASSFLANSGKVLLLSAESHKTHGGSDLYVSFRESETEWTEPKNLGPVVNTFGNEYTPFLAADGITMYFSSNGRRGYGDHDIYITKRLDDTWTKWTEPENLGPEINTESFDAYFTIPADGKYAYVASSKNSIGKLDIFRIKLPETIKPAAVVLIHGKVLNSKTREPICASISYHNLITDKEAGIASSDPIDGSYKITLPPGLAFSFLASKHGFVSVSDNIDLSNLKEYREIERDLYLAPIEEGLSISLNNIFFENSRTELQPSSYAELDRLADVLGKNPGMTIEISGFGDKDGDQQVAKARAEAVSNYLVSKGIEKERLILSNTVASSSMSTDGKAPKRAMEFKILKKM